jgi:hypothetical protein
MLALILGCTATEPGNVDSTDTAAVADEFHPLVPEDYKYLWDTSGCDGNKSRTYILGDARSEDDGTITMTERHYTFYGDADDDWDDDCIDTYLYEGDAITRSDLIGMEASTSEEGYETLRTKSDASTCGGGGWGGDDDAIRWAFDTLTEAGGLNFENRMLVLRFTLGGWGADDDEWKGDIDYARGTFLPDEEANLGPPANYVWDGGGSCGW